MDLSKASSYQSLKTVKAIQIKKILFDREESAKKKQPTDGSAILIPSLKKHKEIKVNDVFVNKNQLTPGGYLILNEDGSKTFLSKEDFAKNYETDPIKETTEPKKVVKK